MFFKPLNKQHSVEVLGGLAGGRDSRLAARLHNVNRAVETRVTEDIEDENEETKRPRRIGQLRLRGAAAQRDPRH